MLHLKLAEEKDIDSCLPLLKDLFNSSIYSKVMQYNSTEVKEHLKRVVGADKNDGCAILLKEGTKTVGILICSSMSHFFNSTEKTAMELAFWIRPDKRDYTSIKTLIKAYKYWAKTTGCTSILLGKLKNSKTTETFTLKRIK